MNKNIFDLKDTSDCPDLKLKLLNIRLRTKNLLSLFDIKSPLSIDEILVGLFRKYDVIEKRSWVNYTLYNLSNKGYVIKLPKTKGVYERLKDE